MTSETVEAWLKAVKRDRQWLADELGTSKRTVDNWLSEGRPIPETSQRFIARLMADVVAVRPKYTPKQFSLIEQAMRAQGYDDIETYVVDTVLRVAEEQASYGNKEKAE